jgi:hypothetical protein
VALIISCGELPIGTILGAGNVALFAVVELPAKKLVFFATPSRVYVYVVPLLV